MSTIDWKRIREQYVRGVPDGRGGRTMPTLAELARIHGLGPGTLRNRSSREKWGPERRTLAGEAPDQARESEGEAGTKALEAAALGISICFLRLCREKRADGDSAELERLSRALDRYQKTYAAVSDKLGQADGDQTTGVLAVPAGVDPEEWKSVLARLRNTERP